MYGNGCKIFTDHAPTKSACQKEILKVQIKDLSASSVEDHISAIKATAIDTMCILGFLVIQQIPLGIAALGLQVTNENYTASFLKSISSCLRGAKLWYFL